MSAEAGLAATAAIDASESQSTAGFNQAIQAAQQMTQAQNFELSINEAAQSSQTGAAACQQADLTCKKAAIQHNDPSGHFIPEVRVLPQDASDSLGKRLIDYANQYNQRAKDFAAELGGAVSKIGEAPVPSATTPSSSSAAFEMSDALRLMQHTFEFAIETSLISNASSLSTRIFNQLMKEQ